MMILRGRALSIGSAAIIAGITLSTSGQTQSVAASRFLAPSNTLTIGWDQAPDTLNPAVTGARSVGPIDQQIFDTLLWMTPSGKVTPDLATRWKVANHGKTFTFYLRHGVKFQDGTPFNAAAVAYNFNYIVKPSTHSVSAFGFMTGFKSARATGKYTVVVSFKSPYVGFLDRVADSVFGMQSPTALAKYGQNAGTHPVGTGPFEFVSYTPNESIVLKRNSIYNWAPPYIHQNGPAKLSGITFDIITDPQARVAALQSGQVQFIDQTPGVNFKILKANPQFKEYKDLISGMGIFLPINAAKWPTNDLAVRKAMLYAIDRAGVVKIVDSGVFPSSWGPLQKGMVGYDPHLTGMYKYNPAKSAQLLQADGWKKVSGIWTKGGKQLTVLLIAISSSPESGRMLQAVQGYLRKAGMIANVRELAVSAWLAAALKGEETIAPSQWADDDPDCLSSWYLPHQYFNWSRVTFPALTKDLQSARGIVNVTKRAHAYWAAEKIIMDQALEMPMHENVDLDVMTNKLSGVKTAAGGNEYFYTASLSS